jgi:hypothetical protein
VPKKPKKPRIKRTKEWKRRSEASKKGWEARKLKKVVDLGRRVAATKPGRERAKPIPVLKKKRKSVDTRIGLLKAEILRLNSIITEDRAPLPDSWENLTEKQMGKVNAAIEAEWRTDAEPEFVKDDGTVALNPSRIRLYALRFRMRIYERLVEAEFHGHLDEECMRIAQEEGMPLREVWSFFKSP